MFIEKIIMKMMFGVRYLVGNIWLGGKYMMVMMMVIVVMMMVIRGEL